MHCTYYYEISIVLIMFKMFLLYSYIEQILYCPFECILRERGVYSIVCVCGGRGCKLLPPPPPLGASSVPLTHSLYTVQYK